jgi:multicomponent Na+:H+ antiporter subunit F
VTVVLNVCIGVLIVAGGLALVRVLLPGTSVADRVVALDLLLLFVVMGIAVFSIERDTDAFLDVLIVVSLLGFVGTVTVARFIERRGT